MYRVAGAPTMGSLAAQEGYLTSVTNHADAAHVVLLHREAAKTRCSS